MIEKPFYELTLFEDQELLEKMFSYFSKLNWNTDTYIIHGKEVTPKRKTFMYGRNYSYSGITKEAIPFDKQVLYISRSIEKKLNLPKNYFNACLCNLYEDGEAYLSYHKDNEKEMDIEAVIVSLSLGCDRKFYLKNDNTKKVEKFIHKQGSILIMEALTQKEWKHSVPKETKVKNIRISLTFRRFL